MQTRRTIVLAGLASLALASPLAAEPPKKTSPARKINEKRVMRDPVHLSCCFLMKLSNLACLCMMKGKERAVLGGVRGRVTRICPVTLAGSSVAHMQIEAAHGLID